MNSVTNPQRSSAQQLVRLTKGQASVRLKRMMPVWKSRPSCVVSNLAGFYGAPSYGAARFLCVIDGNNH
jgi:hypothetical protein